MSILLDEGNLQFDFSSFLAAERFDNRQNNPYGMKAVDFIAEDAECLFFIEVKDFQNPRAPEFRRKEDYEMLIAAGTEKKPLFALEMGAKIKDSLLRKYSLDEKITKKVVYLLLINLDKLGEFERGLLKVRISGHVPTGLNNNRFINFTNISFDLVDKKQLETYGINCMVKHIM